MVTARARIAPLGAIFRDIAVVLLVVHILKGLAASLPRRSCNG